MNCRLILFAAIMLLACSSVHAQAVKDTVTIHFRQGKSDIDLTLPGNREALDFAHRRVNAYQHPDSAFRLIRVLVIGGASPEGSVAVNDRLSRKRADGIFKYIGQWIELPEKLTVYRYLGRDWNGLRRLVGEDKAVPYRSEVLALLDTIVVKTADGESEDVRNLESLRSLRGGKPYRYMYSRLFPEFRASTLILNFDRPDFRFEDEDSVPAPKNELPPFVDTASIPLLSASISQLSLLIPPARRQEKPFYMALKTNMLYDALAVPNIGVEFYTGKNISLSANWMYAWWKTDRRHRYWRIYGGDITARWWFGKEARHKPLTGHHLGIYVNTVTYDFEWGGTGEIGGVPGGSIWDRCNFGGGVEYGYSLPVARRINIDFNVAVGYLGGDYYKYKPIDDHYVWQSTHRRHYFGLTKAEISLVWLVGSGNVNPGKGGAR